MSVSAAAAAAAAADDNDDDDDGDDDDADADADTADDDGDDNDDDDDDVDIIERLMPNTFGKLHHESPQIPVDSSIGSHSHENWWYSNIVLHFWFFNSKMISQRIQKTFPCHDVIV